MSTAHASTRPRLYYAHPLTAYGSTTEAMGLDRLAELLPGCQIVNPAGMFASATAWKRQWPRMLATLDGLVVHADGYGLVGAGVVREVMDAIVARLPLAALADGRLFELSGFDLLGAAALSPARVGYISFGRKLRKGEYLDALRASAATRQAA